MRNLPRQSSLSKGGVCNGVDVVAVDLDDDVRVFVYVDHNYVEDVENAMILTMTTERCIGSFLEQGKGLYRSQDLRLKIFYRSASSSSLGSALSMASALTHRILCFISIVIIVIIESTIPANLLDILDQSHLSTKSSSSS